MPDMSCGGSGRIRTHEGLLPACFQDKCHKPDSATLPKVLKQLSALPELRRLEAAVIVVHVFYSKPAIYFSNDVKEDWEALEEKTAGRLAIGASCRI